VIEDMNKYKIKPRTLKAGVLLIVRMVPQYNWKIYEGGDMIIKSNIKGGLETCTRK
jgi:hypothetical protein